MAHQPGYIEGPWKRFEATFTLTVPPGATYTNGPYFPFTIQPEDVLRFAGGAMVLGGLDASGKLQLVTQRVGIQMQSGYFFPLPMYPPTQLQFPADTYADGAQLILSIPPLEVTGEALGSGGWPNATFQTGVSILNTDSTNSHGFKLTFSLPYQILSRARAV